LCLQFGALPGGKGPFHFSPRFATYPTRFLVFDDPEDHPRIDGKELELLQAKRTSSRMPNEADTTPWKCILTSGPVCAISTAHFASNWGKNQLGTLMPTYLNDVLR